MRSKKRYALFTVFLGGAGFKYCITITGLLVAQLTPEMKSAADHVFTATRLLKTGAVVIFETLFYYFSLNYYNKLIVEKQKAINYIGYSLLLFTVIFGFYYGENYFFPEKNGGHK
ncbi:MAG: hypothetical protein WDM90_17220 [Ferruginibacter sp.]